MSQPGTYWGLQNSLPPLPYNPFPQLAVYELSATNHTYLIDDRSVDYPALSQLQAEQAQMQAAMDGPVTANRPMSPLDLITSSNLWLEIPTNGLSVSNELTVILHNTVEAQLYDMLTTEALNDPITWALEQSVTGAVGTATSTQMPMNGRTNLFIRARTTENVPPAITILAQPMDQDVTPLDMVTFSVTASGNGDLSYQWFCNGTNIVGATTRQYTISSVQASDAASYSVTVSDGTNSVSSRDALLTVEEWSGDLWLMTVRGPRQDYTFKDSMTYYITSPVQLYGTTTLKGGTVIKIDGYYTNAGLVVNGSLVCETRPYYPAVLTSVDDDSAGRGVVYSTGSPHPYVPAAPYLNLDAATNVVLSNLQIRYADQGVTTPLVSRQLDVWDCQFLDCNFAIVNLAPGVGARDSLHNVLFSYCGVAIGAVSNAVEVEAEHVTADVSTFWLASTPPYKLALTNCVIMGALDSGATLNYSEQVVVTASNTVYQAVNAGGYYLPADSPYHQVGSSNISARLRAEFQAKTTHPPMVWPAFYSQTGNLTLSPQAPRDTGNTPDLGYHYDALDYSVAWMVVQGDVTVEPGTAIGFRDEYVPALNKWTWWGFDVREAASFTSHGTPAKPIVYTDLQLVQEQLSYEVTAYFAPDYFSVDTNTPPPTLDFRFSNFYVTPCNLHFWAGYDWYYDYQYTASSLVNLSLQDCTLRGGRICLGMPDDGSVYGLPWDYVYGSGVVSWRNNLFDNVCIDLQPTYYEWNGNVINCDLAFKLRHNLVRGSKWCTFISFPATAGNWTIEDNLFDEVDLVQNPNMPLDFDYNGYWPKRTAALLWPGSDALQLQATTTGDGYVDGAHEQVLSAAPPYQAGPLGDFYLPDTTPLYGAGSTNAGALGLAQYTTSPDQTKEGATHTVNIGLHYVAAASYQPTDNDGDGIPDYMEDANGNGQLDDAETSTTSTMTDGVTLDAYSTVYDTIDLDGDGLTGAAERFFGVNPLNDDNPLKLPAAISSGSLSGVVQIPLNLSSQVDSNTPFLFMVNGTTDNTRVYQTNGQWFAEWNTPMKANGTYPLQLEYEFAEENTAVGSVSLVNVQNDICFPDNYLVAGNALFVRPQTVYTNGTWTMDIYDDQTNLFASLSGAVDANGYCLDPNTAQPGISVSIVDTNGDQLPSAYYTVEVTASSSEAQKNGPAAARAGSSSAAPIRVWTERLWTGNGKWAVDYMPIYGQNISASADLLEMMSFSVNVIEGVYGIENYPVIDASHTSSGSEPFQLRYTSDWGQLRSNLSDSRTRNFFYFGHGASDLIGNGASYLTSSNLQSLLQNAPDPLYGANQHPYRFVFLDGCETGKGDMCTAFGIPKTTISKNEWDAKYYLPARAFVGWKNKKFIGVKNTLNVAHKQYIERFFELWPTTDPNTGAPYRLQDALNAAALAPISGQPYTSLNKEIVIYGCPDLTFR